LSWAAEEGWEGAYVASKGMIKDSIGLRSGTQQVQGGSYDAIAMLMFIAMFMFEDTFPKS
jgi:hypothetical protein